MGRYDAIAVHFERRWYAWGALLCVSSVAWFAALPNFGQEVRIDENGLMPMLSRSSDWKGEACHRERLTLVRVRQPSNAPAHPIDPATQACCDEALATPRECLKMYDAVATTHSAYSIARSDLTCYLTFRANLIAALRRFRVLGRCLRERLQHHDVRCARAPQRRERLHRARVDVRDVLRAGPLRRVPPHARTMACQGRALRRSGLGM